MYFNLIKMMKPMMKCQLQDANNNFIFICISN